MVSFSNNQNQSILLETSNYQFPNFDGEDAFDKNWLQINIEVIDNQKNWKNTDPFLLSYEWLTIAQWFSDRANFKQLKWEGLGFIEPNITFHLKESNRINNTINFDIELSLECIPSFYKEDDIVKYNFSFTSEQCKEIAKMCKKEYEKFPERK
ncbi:MAG: hypothetical protein K6B17_08970 [Treponema sp.]|nr:hypothetical protein [Treponema sp.]